ncbi:MAG: hypothetical protein A2748_00280 [Candidatus Wildermuthbacteria bacterium RIFCSPHIGHO2_01_FULL_45_20]|uniref:Large ribosomal subunit protein bL25 n=1 Tax=Candidatus Wildermuthbacteria bacterium RIFCSPHIGHO2_02_FULL_45_25 TaxID=1802450 RepID=A0A1G2QYF3_9BACT|nr:MAG: hypothetical protein A2748_00280 [Candidatus Wildermuthbacteria bacterium RIFCSPHIGHO2_01_FULL_45_20]OHA65487.1 MAG: hypothetical protein A3C04_02725 [Candidatus Wildermuthbacteria bacterium RIFCSPHIGHO2_02_FULL_45_25]
MLTLTSQQRTPKQNVAQIRKAGFIPAVLYGPSTAPISLQVEQKAFGKVYQEAGESALITLEIGGESAPVLVRDIQLHPMRSQILHIDFYQPRLDEAIEITVPLVFMGESAAVKDLGGTLIRNLQEVDVRALPQDLPHEIKVDISKLATFEDYITIKDLVQAAGVEILREAEDMVAQVVPVEDVEAELTTPVQENVEAVEQVKEKKAEETPEESAE